MRRRVLLALGVFFPALAVAQGTLRTRWAADVGAVPHLEYPRPTMVRPAWVNLNGQWDIQGSAPSHSPGFFAKQKILVPFPIESQLSGVRQTVKPDDRWTYRRHFRMARGKGRVLLHFGAVDWMADVRVNGKLVGDHSGGYDPFTFDVTPALAPSGDNVLEVAVTDPSDQGGQPRGKQVLKPEGIYYTPCSGIWQTVWLERVPDTSIDRLHVQADMDGNLSVDVDVRSRTPLTGVSQKVIVYRSGQVVGSAKGSPSKPMKLQIDKPNLWSPEHPNLYQMKVMLIRGGKAIDSVQSYCAFRTVGAQRDTQGINRIYLNGQPQFVVGPLDQGFWPDGIYTAPTEAAMLYDLQVTKRLGFNMIRKHVKVEPETWYTACDRIGLMVFQDMPSGDNKTDQDMAEFDKELTAMIDARRNHPCIVAWVLFNEGWGQHDTERIASWLKTYEPNRVLDSVTGWTDKGVGNLMDIHAYPGPARPPLESKRAAFLGEFGGLGLPTPGHMWREKGWGYQTFKTPEELTDRFVDLFRNLRLLEAEGLAGAVYTQTTDVETELNGLMTYDRATVKMNEARVQRAIGDLFLPTPKISTVLPTSENSRQSWEYSFKPSPGWTDPDFNATQWSVGPGGFGTAETPGAVVGTPWTTSDIYLRRSFNLRRDFAAGELMLRIHHDDDVEVWLDGKPLWRTEGWTTGYTYAPLQVAVAKGPHTLAIHCHQDKGGQFIDAGLVLLRDQ